MIHVMRTLAAVMLFCLAAPVLTAQRDSSAQLSRAGWDALNAGRLAEAAAAFDAGLKVSPQQPSVLLGAGIAAHLRGREDEARRLLVDALKLQPSLTEASLVLGAVLYKCEDIDGAIDTYQQALIHAPDHPRLLQQLEAWRKEATLHSRFGHKLGSHFTVLFEGPAEAQLAERAVAILEAAYVRIGAALYTYPLTSSPSSCTRASSSTTSRNPPSGQEAPTMAASACRCRERSRIRRSSSAS